MVSFVPKMGYGIIYVLIYGNSLAHICRHALLETRLVADIILGKRKSAVKPPFGTGVRNSVNPVGFPSETSTMNHSNILFTEQHPIAEDTEGDKVVYDTRSGVGLQGHLASWLTDGPRGFVYPAEIPLSRVKSFPHGGPSSRRKCGSLPDIFTKKDGYKQQQR